MTPVLLSFAIALASSLVLTPVVRAIARRTGYVASPSTDRWHTKPTALLGGVAIYGAFLVAVIAYVLLSFGPDRVGDLPRSAIGVIISASLMFAVGYLDDRIHMRPATKLLGQVVGAAIVISFGVVVPLTDWFAVNVLITLFWFLAITNAINLLDNMDGVAAGVSVIAVSFMGLIFFAQGQMGLAAVCGALAGATLGFLPYNFKPASIFMGDSGSLLLGSIIGSVGILYPKTAAAGIIPVLFVPVFILIIPILDTLLVTTTRTLAGRSISWGGRDHTTHRLVALGLSERQVALLLYAFAIAGGLFGLGLGTTTFRVSTMLLGSLFLIALGLAAAYLSRMHVYSDGRSDPARPVTILVSDLLHKKRALEFVLDVVLFTVAAYGAYLLRYEGAIPAEQREILEKSLGVIIAAYALAFAIAGVYRGKWSRVSVSDAHRLLMGTVAGAVLSTALLVLFFRDADFSRSVLLLNALLAGLLTTGSRLTFRSIDVVRHSFRKEGEVTLIYGAGGRGEIARRELAANMQLDMRAVGFIDDELHLQRRVLLGLPVLGTVNDVERLVRRLSVTRILVAAESLPPHRLDELHRVSALLQVTLLRCAFSVEEIEPPATRPHLLTRKSAGD